MNPTLKGFPISELPRERLLRDGIEALSIQELIAILLGTGTQGKPVFSLANELLFHFGGMQGLLNASVEELIQFKGIGQAKAVLLKAAFGIALRSAREGIAPKKRIVTDQDVIELASVEIGEKVQEALLVILRDVRCTLIHHEVVGLGTLTEVLVHPREVFRLAVRHGAHSLIVCHNHPSGDPTPSRADLSLTAQLLDCAKLMGIPLSDHFILGKNGSYTSIKKHLSV